MEGIRTFVIMCNDVPEMVFVDKGIQGNGVYPKDELIVLIEKLRQEHKAGESESVKEHYNSLFHWKWYPMQTTFSKEFNDGSK